MTRTKRPNGTGSIERTKSGRWRVRVLADGRRRSLGTFDTEGEARRILAAFNEEVREEAIVAPGSVTVRAFADEWLTRRELHGSPTRAEVKGAHGERLMWEHHVCAHELADLAVQSVRPRDVEGFASWLRRREAVQAVRTREGTVRRPTGRTLGVQSQRHVMRLVRQFFAAAVRAELLERNPAEGVRVASKGRSARKLDDDWLRADDLDALLGCEDISIRDRTAYACAVGLALRLNDLKRLRVADVHLDAEVPGPHVVVVVAKSERTHRVPVMPWLVPWLRAHLDTLPAGSRWLFPTSDGSRYASKTYDFRWAAKRERRDGVSVVARPSALELAGIERRVRFHDLRGTCATHLALGTWGRVWSLHEIQRMLAHSDQRTTERYVRRAQDALAAAAAGTSGGPGVPKSAPWGRGRLPAVAHGDPEKLNTPGTIRTSDQRLRKSFLGPEIPSTSGHGCPRAGNAPAEELLRAVADGGDTVPRAMLHALADEVLDAPIVRLALEVRAGGPHALARAVELAELVIDTENSRTASAVEDR